MNNCQLYYISDTSVSWYQHSAIAKQLLIFIEKYKLNESLDVVDVQWCGKVFNMLVMPFVSFCFPFLSPIHSSVCRNCESWLKTRTRTVSLLSMPAVCHSLIVCVFLSPPLWPCRWSPCRSPSRITRRHLSTTIENWQQSTVAFWLKRKSSSKQYFKIYNK